MKEALRAGGTPIPRFAAARTLAEASEACRAVGFPAVVKPADNSAARGVTLVAGPGDVERAYRTARAHALADPTLLVEEYLPGPQLSTESIWVDGELVTTGFADRNYARNAELAPHFVEDGHTVPSELEPAARPAVESLVAHASASLGIRWGVVKGDIVLAPDGPRVIEIAARLSGGRFSTDTVPLATGVEIVEAAILQAIGEEPDPQRLRPRHRRAAAQRYLFPPRGTVRDVHGVERARRLPGVTRVEVYVRPGDTQPAITHHAARAGYVIATADDRATAVRRAEAAVAEITIEVDPAADAFHAEAGHA
jgi:biotin carboxylase